MGAKISRRKFKSGQTHKHSVKCKDKNSPLQKRSSGYYSMTVMFEWFFDNLEGLYIGSLRHLFQKSKTVLNKEIPLQFLVKTKSVFDVLSHPIFISIFPFFSFCAFFRFSSKFSKRRLLPWFFRNLGSVQINVASSTLSLQKN